MNKIFRIVQITNKQIFLLIRLKYLSNIIQKVLQLFFLQRTKLDDISFNWKEELFVLRKYCYRTKHYYLFQWNTLGLGYVPPKFNKIC